MRRPGLAGFLFALLALFGQLSAAAAPMAGPFSGIAAGHAHDAVLAAAHICGASQPGTPGDHAPSHDENTCPACTVCGATAGQAILPPAVPALAAPVPRASGAQQCRAPSSLLPGRRFTAAMPTGPPFPT